ncbi:MAG TPA: ABC transporter substrate-binding protein [Firmicutes bacterium]|nr:ABC transporter substrate-binding protein [Bacillota bacterium]
MKNKKLILILAAVLVVVVAAVFLLNTQRAAKPSTFKLGILLPYTGTFAAVAKTQQQGVLLAVEQRNAEGGLNMPWGKVKIEYEDMDDEANINTGVRRFRYLRDQGAHAVVGQTWAAVSLAINELCIRDPYPYFPVNVAPLDSYRKGKMGDCTYAAGYTPWTVGYMAGKAAINDLGKKRIFYLGRSDSWGWDIRDGLAAAAKKYGGEIIGQLEVAQGTSDFTTVLEQVRAAKPDVFISAQFGGDAISLLKQCYDMGLNKEMTIFNSFLTNVVAQGLPLEARENIYGMHFFYYDLTGFEDAETVKLAAEYSKAFMDKWGTPPDAYATIAYIAVQQLFDAVEKAGSFDQADIRRAIEQNPEFMSVKGPAYWREDHEAVYEYAGFLVRGKGRNEAKHEFDFFEVVSVQGGEEVYPNLKDLGF